MLRRRPPGRPLLQRRAILSAHGSEDCSPVPRQGRPSGGSTRSLPAAPDPGFQILRCRQEHEERPRLRPQSQRHGHQLSIPAERVVRPHASVCCSSTGCTSTGRTGLSLRVAASATARPPSRSSCCFPSEPLLAANRARGCRHDPRPVPRISEGCPGPSGHGLLPVGVAAAFREGRGTVSGDASGEDILIHDVDDKWREALRLLLQQKQAPHPCGHKKSAGIGFRALGQESHGVEPNFTCRRNLRVAHEREMRKAARHFDRIAEAPDAVPRLRRFILDLAVRGKLVEQDPNDEPASELLKRIQPEQDTAGSSSGDQESKAPPSG